MIDEHLVDEVIAVMLKKAGVKIQKDDPILMNALIIQIMLREQVDLTRQISDEMVSATVKTLETTTEKFSADLAEKLTAQSKNSGIFIESFREILRNQSAEKHDMNALAKPLAVILKPQITTLVVVQGLTFFVLLALAVIVLLK